MICIYAACVCLRGRQSLTKGTLARQHFGQVEARETGNSEGNGSRTENAHHVEIVQASLEGLGREHKDEACQTFNNGMLITVNKLTSSSYYAVYSGSYNEEYVTCACSHLDDMGV